MPSPDMLPNGRSFPSAAAPPLDDVLKRARLRRTRRAGVFAAVVVVAAAGVTIAFVPHGASDSLHSVTPAVHRQSASPAPHTVTAHLPRKAQTAVMQARQRAASQRATHLAAVAHPKASRADQSVMRQPAVTHDPSTRATRIVGPAHRMTRFKATHGCNGSGPVTATGWCSYYSGATGGTAGHTVTLATSVCRLPGQSTGVLQSSTGYQADFDAGRRAYPPVWTWSHGRAFTKAPTSIRVPAGACVEWYVSWRIVNDAGRPLKPGTYYLDATPQMGSTGAASAGAFNPRTFVVR